MFGKCLITLSILTGLASSTSQAAPLARQGQLAEVTRPVQGVVLATGQDDAHARGRFEGLIIWGDPWEKFSSIRMPSGSFYRPNKGKGTLPKTGLIIWGDPWEKVKIGTGFQTKLPSGRRPSSGRVSAVTWTALDGAELTLEMSSGIDLADIDALVAPAGEWVDLTLELDGPLYLDGEVGDLPYGLTLDVQSWTMPFEEPLSSDGSVEVVIDAELPSLLVDEVQAQEGLVVEPGDALHDSLAHALLDSAFARAR